MFYFSGAGNLLSTAIPHSAASPLHSGIFVSIRASVAGQVASTGSATIEISVFVSNSFTARIPLLWRGGKNSKNF
ncbi:hypothetical protein [Chryseobacterium profundimaris]|uniref:hypothetical protein n=1 Tax=Chryseobacterium profundimaris TaxID=1387275 RepID=UPI0024B77047|nr:hypothetical protein [Chryseobacterium profundimaris]